MSKYNGIDEFESNLSIKINTDALHFDREVKKTLKSDTIEIIRKELTNLVDIAYKRPDQIEYQGMFGVERDLPREVFHTAKTFFLPPDFDYNKLIFFNCLDDKNFGLKSENGFPRFVGRYMFPIMDFKGDVMGLIGYDKHSDVKYLLSTSIGFQKNNSFYGMWMMAWIYTKGFVLVVEGIIDCLWLWSLGIPAIALNGNNMNAFVARILKRFGYRVLLCPDNDETGEASLPFWLKLVPNASVLKIDVGNDLDRWRRIRDEIDGNKAYENLLFEIIGKFEKYSSEGKRTNFEIRELDYILS